MGERETKTVAADTPRPHEAAAESATDWRGCLGQLTPVERAASYASIALRSPNADVSIRPAVLAPDDVAHGDPPLFEERRESDRAAFYDRPMPGNAGQL